MNFRPDETSQSVEGQYFARGIVKTLVSTVRSSVAESTGRPPPPPRVQCWAETASRGRACKTFVHFEASSRGLFFNIEIGGRGGGAPPARNSQPGVLQILLAKYCPCSVAPVPRFPVPPFAVSFSTRKCLARRSRPVWGGGGEGGRAGRGHRDLLI